MERTDTQREKELNCLKLALATFALRLDAFEARLKSKQVQANTVLSPVLRDSRFMQEVIVTQIGPDAELAPELVLPV